MRTSTEEPTPQDPTTVRLSKHFLLSDFLGCDYVYRHGHPNGFPRPESLREGKVLCEHLLEPLLARSRLSVSYGYISPGLSRAVVKYQDPNKPSYHRWDAGAACDVVLHDSKLAPIEDAIWVDENLPASRVITYSESSFICVATRHSEVDKGDPRRALYENRYVPGQRKPMHINYSQSASRRSAMKAEAKKLSKESGWMGQGWPSYHGGGRRQMHHYRTSRYTMLSDFLYSREATTFGYRNLPCLADLGKFELAGAAYDSILKSISARRLSIVRGFESPSWSSTRHVWEDGVYFVVVPPEGVDPSEVADAALSCGFVRKVRLSKNNRVAIALSL